MEVGEIRETYLSEVKRLKVLEEKESRIILILSVIRLFVFFAGIVFTWLAFLWEIIAGFIVLFVSASAFLFLVRLFGSHSEKRSFLTNLIRINLDEAAALSGDISQFNNGETYSDRDHSFSFDTDLFGENSLFQYLNRTVTGYGRDILASWLKDPYVLASDLDARQEAIRDLAKRREWRQRFLASGMKVPLERMDIKRFETWLVEQPTGRGPFIEFLLRFALPVLTVSVLICSVTGLLPVTAFTSIFILNLIIVAAGIRSTNAQHRSLTGMHAYLSSLEGLIRTFANEDFSSKVLSEAQKSFMAGDVSAATALKRLTGLLHEFDTRLNIIVAFLLNGLLLWDYRCIRRLESWNLGYRAAFPVWLEMTGTIDAFISLANYSFNNPGYPFPHAAYSGMVLEMRNCGHPLIHPEERIGNDFVIRKKGELCVITGANMSGKSTFLRTVAVNYILAMAGAPVCAEEMNFIPVELFTSMRTTDSLAGNESYFYAELKRLRQLKEKLERGEPVFFILDEILKGTNSADKSLGSRLFTAKLVALGATGLIATHDITLGELENEFHGSVFNMCFEVTIEGELISFDYKLRKGITMKMNAAILMKQMGILD